MIALYGQTTQEQSTLCEKVALVLLTLPIKAATSPCAGATEAFDHNALVHTLWKKFLHMGMEVQICRVPTDDNIADNPSRHKANPALVQRIVCSLALQGGLRDLEETGGRV